MEWIYGTTDSMPTTSFRLHTPVGAEHAWRYVRDYANVTEWDATVRSVEALDQGDAWAVTLARWPALRLTHHRDCDDAPWDGSPRVVRFMATNHDATVRMEEVFTVCAAPLGTEVTYTMQLGMGGWRRLPCVGAAVWVHLRSEAARTQERLAQRLVVAASAREAVLDV